jgi:transmembrane sensor
MNSELSLNREDAEAAAAQWLARRERVTWGAADDAALSEWIAADFNHRAAWLRLSTAWQQTERLKALNTHAPRGSVPARTDLHLPFFTRAPHTESAPAAAQSRRKFYRRPQTWAAGLLLVMLCGVAGYRMLTPPSYQTQIGALQAIPLSDGSRVTLNTNTAVRVTVSATERRVALQQGEAYFEVAKDPGRPFIVEAGGKRIVAVGTQFSVRREARDVQVIVTEGAVRVDAGEKGGTLLRAGAMARARGEDVRVQIKPVAEAEQALSWRSGYLVFDRTPLAEAVAEFNRYNTRRILIGDATLGSIPVGGNFRVANVEAFIRLIERELAVVSEERGEQIILQRKANN